MQRFTETDLEMLKLLNARGKVQVPMSTVMDMVMQMASDATGEKQAPALEFMSVVVSLLASLIIGKAPDVQPDDFESKFNTIRMINGSSETVTGEGLYDLLSRAATKDMIFALLKAVMQNKGTKRAKGQSLDGSPVAKKPKQSSPGANKSSRETCMKCDQRVYKHGKSILKLALCTRCFKEDPSVEWSTICCRNDGCQAPVRAKGLCSGCEKKNIDSKGMTPTHQLPSGTMTNPDDVPVRVPVQCC